MECEGGRGDKQSCLQGFCSEYQEKQLAIYWDREDRGDLEGGGSEVHFGHIYFKILS